MSLATSNAFALLNKGAGKGKKDEKGKDDKKKRGKDDKAKSASAADLEKAIFSQPSMNISNWADEDDDEYTMPALPIDWAEAGGAGAEAHDEHSEHEGHEEEHEEHEESSEGVDIERELGVERFWVQQFTEATARGIFGGRMQPARNCTFITAQSLRGTRSSLAVGTRAGLDRQNITSITRRSASLFLFFSSLLECLHRATDRRGLACSVPKTGWGWAVRLQHAWTAPDVGVCRGRGAHACGWPICVGAGPRARARA